MSDYIGRLARDGSGPKSFDYSTAIDECEAFWRADREAYQRLCEEFVNRLLEDDLRPNKTPTELDRRREILDSTRSALDGLTFDVEMLGDNLRALQQLCSAQSKLTRLSRDRHNDRLIHAAWTTQSKARDKRRRILEIYDRQQGLHPNATKGQLQQWTAEEAAKEKIATSARMVREYVAKRSD